MTNETGRGVKAYWALPETELTRGKVETATAVSIKNGEQFIGRESAGSDFVILLVILSLCCVAAVSPRVISIVK